ncbi:hypothetical protein Moror_5736 [Moniliophthora roreri MCA 2997]|uniref:Uncharacterized protein n=1 Tax=Moniliophthora roreri (strain MCA 2997) TaxID=1381753 RepID=V2X0H8_MONRO|nr:hypothetical protein Moror_5736 [Moniliophthora roreri MCA 2997]
MLGAGARCASVQIRTPPHPLWRLDVLLLQYQRQELTGRILQVPYHLKREDLCSPVYSPLKPPSNPIVFSSSLQ